MASSPKNTVQRSGCLALHRRRDVADDAKRDGHLRSPDFLDAEKYPEIKSTKIERRGDNDWLARGDLTIAT